MAHSCCAYWAIDMCDIRPFCREYWFQKKWNQIVEPASQPRIDTSARAHWRWHCVCVCVCPYVKCINWISTEMVYQRVNVRADQSVICAASVPFSSRWRRSSIFDSCAIVKCRLVLFVYPLNLILEFDQFYQNLTGVRPSIDWILHIISFLRSTMS